jgi:hypothetical protein
LHALWISCLIAGLALRILLRSSTAIAVDIGVPVAAILVDASAALAVAAIVIVAVILAAAFSAVAGRVCLAGRLYKPVIALLCLLISVITLRC